MRDTSAAGDIAEAVILAEFTKLGFQVNIPIGTQRYDLIIDTGTQLLKVQCKVASRCGWNGDKSAIRFHASSPRYAAGKFQGRDGYEGYADLFAAYAPPPINQVYVLRVDECPATDVWLRLEKTTANNQHGIRLASDHTIERWAERQAVAITVTTLP